MYRQFLATFLVIAVAAGCDRKSATTPPGQSVSAAAVPTGGSVASTPAESKAAPAVPKVVPPEPPYDANWRREATGEAAAGLQVKAQQAIQELKAAGHQVGVGEQSCRAVLAAKAAADGGTIQADQLRLLQLAGVTDLTLGDVSMGDAGMAQLSTLRCLQRITAYRGNVTVAGFAALKPLRDLAYIDFAGSSDQRLVVTGEGIEHLAGCPKLTTVGLRSSGATDAGLAGLAKLPALTDLYLEGNQLTDAALGHMRALTRLQLLDLKGNPVSGTGFKDLAGLTKLEKVDLEGCPVTDAGAAALASLPVRFLFLYKSQVTDVGVGALARSKTLRHLRLDRTAVTDAGLKPLAALATLEYLNLRRTAVTDVGLETLATFPKLKELEVTSGPMLTSAAVEKLKKAKPGLAVTISES